MFFLQVHKRVNGVAGFRQVEFNVRHFEFIVVMDGGTYHIVPVMLMKKSLARFEWILRRHNKPHFLQVTTLCHQVGNDEMAHVDGIERTEEETYFHTPKSPKGDLRGQITHRNL